MCIWMKHFSVGQCSLKTLFSFFINMTVMEHQKLPSYNFNDGPVIRSWEAVKEILKMSPDSAWWSEINIMTASIKFINVTMCNRISPCMSYKTFKLYIAALKVHGNYWHLTSRCPVGVSWRGWHIIWYQTVIVHVAIVIWKWSVLWWNFVSFSVVGWLPCPSSATIFSLHWSCWSLQSCSQQWPHCPSLPSPG